MHIPTTPLSLVLALALLISPTLSSEDINYDPATNYRPENVTGLDYYYYPWVGSYYNGTATFTITGLSIRSRSYDEDEDQELCTQLQNYTYTLSYPALLAITETEPEDERPENTNPVNMILSTSYSNFTKYFNDYMDSSNMQIKDEPWVFESIDVSRRNYGYETTNPNFNLSMVESIGADTPYRVTGSSSGEDNSLQGLQTNMSSCSKIEDWWGVTFYSEVVMPALQLTFDAHAASFTLVSGAVMNTLGTSNSDDDMPQLAGRIAVEFLGRIDEARSDVLRSPGSEGEPRWLRTVGFGNNSANLDYGLESAASNVVMAGGALAGVLGLVGYLLL
ncbi:uncharacterized protein BDW70DRAFT_169819 [Aspergillus foveolatus]|uniref:uncharacterized protein n=1 Tax=Aspergillus foveolatus TaxID=210207 RepID=UPI003CCCD068